MEEPKLAQIFDRRVPRRIGRVFDFAQNEVIRAGLLNKQEKIGLDITQPSASLVSGQWHRIDSVNDIAVKAANRREVSAEDLMLDGVFPGVRSVTVSSSVAIAQELGVKSPLPGTWYRFVPKVKHLMNSGLRLGQM